MVHPMLDILVLQDALAPVCYEALKMPTFASLAPRHATFVAQNALLSCVLRLLAGMPGQLGFEKRRQRERLTVD